MHGRDAILRVRVKWLIFNIVLQLWADVKYHVPTGFGFAEGELFFYVFVSVPQYFSTEPFFCAGGGKDGEDDADDDESQRGDDDANGGEIGDSEKHEVDVGNPQYDGRNPSHPLDVHFRAIFFAGGVVAGYPPVGFACSNQYSQNE